MFTLSILLLVSSVVATPLLWKREGPQEHSHEATLRIVRQFLNHDDNPDKIVDPVFGLRRTDEAMNGTGNIQDTDCLQQAIADQAFTNAKAVGDVNGMVHALIFRALERNTGAVGKKSKPCTSLKAKNAEIAALSQHQDPASDGAAATNKAITLELAKQIKSVGGNPLDAIKSGTFAPGKLTDTTAKGNTCDDENDAEGCIFSQKLLVPDATEEEILAAVGGTETKQQSNEEKVKTTTTPTSTPAGNCPANPTTKETENGLRDFQTFTEALGGMKAPAVTKGGHGFEVANDQDFVALNEALNRSCDVQMNQCADAAKANRNAGFSVGDCNAQHNRCRI